MQTLSEQTRFDTPEYRRARRAYRWECTFEYFVSLLVADAFLTRLLHAIGFDDAACGLISSIITLAFLFQLVSVFVVRRITDTKRVALPVHIAGQLLFTLLYAIPFLPVPTGVRKVMTVGFLLGAYFCNYLVTNLIYRWGNSFVDPARRARYSASKEMLSLMTGIPVSLGLGAVMDHFIETDNLTGGFLFAAAAMLVFVLCDLVCLLLIGRERRQNAADTSGAASPAAADAPAPMRDVLRATLGNRAFRRVVVLYSIFEMARFSLVGFLGTFKQFDLGYTVAAVEIINMVGSLGRTAVSPLFGRFADRHSYIKTIELATLIMMAAFAAIMFTTPGTRWLIVVYALLYAVSMAGSNQNFLNITFSYVEPRFFVEATAIKNSIGGLCGFLAALLSRRLLAYVQARGNVVFGLPLYGQQLLAAIALLLAAASLVYAHFVVGRERITGK